jgi:acyl carrier protein
MTDAEILAGIREVLAEHLGLVAPIELEDDLGHALALDSMQRLTLVVELESRFRVRLDPADDGALSRVSDLVRLIRQRAATGPSQEP